MKKFSFTRIITALTIMLSVQCSLIADYPQTPPRNDISVESWNIIYPYLLPLDSEIMDKLESIFGKSRVTLNSDTMVRAGFTTGKIQSWSRILVTKHPKVPGYVFKIYLDDLAARTDLKAQYYFEKRVRGANATRNFIDENNLSHLFKVPKKWIYLLPETAKPNKKYSFKNFILVEEDMQILSKKENKKAWKSSQVNKETLIGLHKILKGVGLLDCSKIDNIPFSIDGKIAFIDTETSGQDWIPYEKLKKSLSSKMRHFWKDLTHDEGY